MDDAKRELGPLGRLTYWCVANSRRVFVGWIVAVVCLGVFLPKVQHSLSGAGMERTGSESVDVREAVRSANPLVASSAISVVMHGEGRYGHDRKFRRAAIRVAATLAADSAIDGTMGPTRSGLISRDRRTVIVTGGAGGDTKAMIKAADRLRSKVKKAAGPSYDAYISGLSAQWADFNKEHKEATLRSEAQAFPISLAVLVLAFGSLVAAGMPLLITAIALAITGGILFLGTHLIDISIWALTFVMIFSVALGIDYALFIVMRFRDAMRELRSPVDAAAATMDTAGRAIAFSGTTVLVALIPTFLIPSPMPHSIALGTMLSVVVVMAVTFTLMPTLLARLGPRIDAGRLPWQRKTKQAVEPADRRMARWGEFVWRNPWPLAAGTIAILILLALPVGHLKIGIPSDKVQTKDAPSRIGANLVEAGFGGPALSPVTVVVKPDAVREVRAIMRGDRDLLAVRSVPVRPGSEYRLLQASMTAGRDSEAAGDQIDRLRELLPPGAQVGHAPAELHDVRVAMEDIAPLVIALILLLGFLLLLVAVQAPLIAFAGTLTSLLSTGAAFGVTVLIFQDGHLSGLLAFESQGFLDFWAPVFFFAMIFAIAMDYTVFYVSAAREEWDRTGNTRNAVVSGMGRSGPVIVAAAAAMIAVYATFAACPAVAAKEMGTILGLSVLLDAFLVRLTLLPAIMRLGGKWTWWQPAVLARIMPSFSLSHGGSADEESIAAPTGRATLADRSLDRL